MKDTNLPNVTFAPNIHGHDFGYEVEEEIVEKDDDWIISWNGVHINDKETALSIIKEQSASMIVSPNHEEWVLDQINKKNKESWWTRFKRWLLTLFRFPQ